jgi:hypothetical protein
MKMTPILSALPFAVGACITSSELCPAGFLYSTQYGICLAVDAGADADTDASEADPVAEAGTPEASATDASGDSAGGDGNTGFGIQCSSSSNCTGAANYCLVAPGGTGGFCSITNCAAGECPSAYACCTCTSSALPSLQSYPPGVCVPSASEAQITALGCTCQ